MELLPEVFIKEQHESGIDQVMVVRNLPKHLIYRRVPKMVQRYDRDGYTDGTIIPDPKGETVEALLEGLEFSQTDDGSIVFTHQETAKVALRAIDAYVNGTLPRDIVVPKRVAYPLDPSNSRSMPKPKSMIPVVELPASKAEAPQVSLEGKTSPVSSAPIKKRKELTEQQKEAARERMARAREVRKQKAITESAPQA